MMRILLVGAIQLYGMIFIEDILWMSLTALVIFPYYNCESVMRTQESKINVEPREVEYTDEVGHCLREGGGVASCLKAGAFVYLEAASQRRNIAITDDLELYENDIEPQETRTNFPFPIGENGETTDFNTLMEASTRFLQRRTLHWSLDFLYPGLQLCVGGSNSGPPSLQFLLDPRQSADERKLTTGRLLVKRAILPYLLGLKLNLVTIMPLLFAALIVLTKKAFILSKFAFLLMAMMGFSTASHLTHHQLTNPIQGYGLNSGTHESSFLKDFGQMLYNRGDNAGRNFVWEEKEKKMSARNERERKRP